MTSLGRKSGCTFSARILQTSTVWIEILRSITENELDGGVETDETIMVS